MQIKVKNKRIGGDAPAFIIAEIGTNNNGRLDLALRMVEEASKTGVDAIKFQVVNPDESYVRGSASYNIFKKVYLDFNALKRIKIEAEKRNLIFFATAGDLSSLEALLKLKVPLIKISSGCMTNTLLIREAAKTGLPIVISTGMAYLKEVKKAISELEKSGAKDIVILHCVSRYPAKYEELNLNSIKTLQSQFKYPIGFSDHTMGSIASLAAVSMGAKVIEKHFTLSKRLKGPDHYFSSEPKELKQLVDGIRDIEKMTGSYVKKPARREMQMRNKMRRFLVFAEDLARGIILEKKSIGLKRLNHDRGLPSEYYDTVLYKKTLKDVKKDQTITLDLLTK